MQTSRSFNLGRGVSFLELHQSFEFLGDFEKLFRFFGAFSELWTFGKVVSFYELWELSL